MNILFKALNDPTRRDILELLKDKDMTAGDIADKFSISKPSISHHLDFKLRQAGLVVFLVKEGRVYLLFHQYHGNGRNAKMDHAI